MVIDTSAIMAILGDEPERVRYNRQIAGADKRLMSTGTYLETAIVVQARHGAAGSRDLQLLISTAQIELVSFDSEQAVIAKQAYASYGKGRHPAALNFGDCFAYALSRSKGEPLLFKGGDFSKTDVTPADANT